MRGGIFQMEIMDAIRAALKELIIPELDKIKEENVQIKITQELTNKRLDDVNLHLVDQSRRIDESRTELTQRMDETNKRIDEVRTELTQRMDVVRTELTQRMDRTNERMDQLYQAVVRREEHGKLEGRVIHLEQEMQEMKLKLAA